MPVPSHKARTAKANAAVDEVATVISTANQTTTTNALVTINPKDAAQKHQRSWTGAACLAVKKAASKTASLALRGSVNFISGVGGAIIMIPSASRIAPWMVYSGTEFLYGPVSSFSVEMAKRHAAANYAALVGTNVIGGVLGVQLGQYVAWSLISFAYRSGKELHKKWQQSGKKNAAASFDDAISPDDEPIETLPPTFCAKFKGLSVPMYANSWENVPDSMKIESDRYPHQWVRWQDESEEDELTVQDSEQDCGAQQTKPYPEPVEQAEVLRYQNYRTPLICRMMTLHMLVPKQEGETNRKHFVGKMLLAKCDEPEVDKRLKLQ